ncbi:NUDIX hydrolase domain-like protein [Syncephalastrum racemosum]|uniref:NUDIX hydrolase domain-like protein n=1 Tax=Syncephalastrum racemosum TaxID=13706 RepID=A0A1X2HDZ4_SYNRA|nr:NUDIX hydrolase domain-like protein [Syncephalastrum racemosum]
MMNYPAEARTGREKQRYDEDDVRQVAGCLPIDPLTRRVMLISSSKHPNTWVFPKGGWENDETREEAAQRETYEEAGVRGRITRYVGNYYEYTKKGNAKTRFWVYELEIQEILKKWPEKKKRERRWFTFEEALLAMALHKPFMQEALRQSSLAPTYHATQPQGALHL